jgi:hypothetical protein
MTFWVKRIILKTGELVTERELSRDENFFDKPAPHIGDKIIVSCRGRTFEARVVWRNCPDWEEAERSIVVPIRVEEI